MPAVVFCGLCGAETRAKPYQEPRICPSCKRETRWRSKPLPSADATGDPGDENVPGWNLTEEDFRILRSNRIAPD